MRHMSIDMGMGLGLSRLSRGGGSADIVSAASASFGVFSSANYYGTAAGINADYDFALSTTFGFIFNSRTLINFQIPFAYCDATHGWVLRVSATVALLRFRGGTDITISGFVNTLGLHHIWVTRLAGGSVRGSVNGRTASLYSAAPTYVAGGASSRLSIGYNSGEAANACTGIDALHVIKIGAEASDAELTAWSGQTNSQTDRYSPHSAARSHASLRSWLSADRDHVQANANIVAGAGSTPWTIPKVGTGAPHNTIKSERYLALTAADILDGRRFDLEDGGSRRHGLFSHFVVAGSFTKLSFDYYTDNDSRAGIAVDGVGSTNSSVASDGLTLLLSNTTPSGTNTTVVDSPGTDGGAHTWDAIDGLQSRDGGSGEILFTGIQAVRYPADESITITSYAAPSKRIHIETDSLFQRVETAGSVPTRQSCIALMRANAVATFRVSADGYGSRQFSSGESSSAPDNNISTAAGRTALAARMVANLDGTTQNELMLSLMTNDYGIGGMSKATYKTNVSAFFTELASQAAGVAGFRAWFLLATSRSTEATPNSSGAVLQDFRDAITELVPSFAWLNTLDGPTMLGTPAGTPANFGADGLHWSTVGHGVAEAAIRAATSLY
jgi:hypothetical protein